MYSIWPLLIISISLLIIIFIIFRKFPELAVLDVDNIPEEKERHVKEKIIRERMRRKFSFLDPFIERISFLSNKLSVFLWGKLEKIKENQKKIKSNRNLKNINPEERIKILFDQSKEFIKKDELDSAEKKLIEIISLDDKNFKAFLELGDVYKSEEKWQEAKQTLLYASKLSKSLDEKDFSFNDLSNLHYSLALINKELGDISEAISSISRSIDIDSKNPRYLDLMVDLCIMKGDRDASLKFLNRIKEFNPDNNNISDWEEKIETLPR
jgi:tetratricopeptide (TPR) repeat protein